MLVYTIAPRALDRGACGINGKNYHTTATRLPPFYDTGMRGLPAASNVTARAELGNIIDQAVGRAALRRDTAGCCRPPFGGAHVSRTLRARHTAALPSARTAARRRSPSATSRCPAPRDADFVLVTASARQIAATFAQGSRALRRRAVVSARAVRHVLTVDNAHTPTRRRFWRAHKPRGVRDPFYRDPPASSRERHHQLS